MHIRMSPWWLTEDVVGAGGVEGDVDGGDVVVGVADVAAPQAQALPREVAPHNVLVTLVPSLWALVCNEMMMITLIGDRFLLIDTTQRMSYRLHRAGLVMSNKRGQSVMRPEWSDSCGTRRHSESLSSIKRRFLCSKMTYQMCHSSMNNSLFFWL